MDFTVTGEPRPLSEAASLVAYRTAQEGLTNARKHAPGQPVALSLGFEAGQLTVSVVNPLPPAGQAGPLADHRGRGRPDRPAGARRAGRRHARGGAGRRDLAGMPEDSGMTENPEPVTVVVADDQSAVRQGLVLLLGTVPGIAVTGEAEDGEAAVEIVAAEESAGRAHGPEHAALRRGGGDAPHPGQPSRRPRWSC